VVEERLKPEGEQDVVALPGIVRGGEVQSDPDDRMDVQQPGGRRRWLAEVVARHTKRRRSPEMQRKERGRQAPRV
jgi:hypothetical protein